MTDNRTNEELAVRLRQLAESQEMDFDSPHVAMTLNEVADRLVKPSQNTGDAAELDRILSTSRTAGGREEWGRKTRDAILAAGFRRSRECD